MELFPWNAEAKAPPRETSSFCPRSEEFSSRSLRAIKMAIPGVANATVQKWTAARGSLCSGFPARRGKMWYAIPKMVSRVRRFPLLRGSFHDLPHDGQTQDLILLVGGEHQEVREIESRLVLPHVEPHPP